MIYLDNSATTCLSEPVRAAMMEFITKDYMYGNPGSIYKMGSDAGKIVSKARESVAKFINAEPEQIIFTSCGSESNNLAIKGSIELCSKYHGVTFNIVTSSYEHDSVLKSAEYISGWLNNVYGIQHIMIDPDPSGIINPESLRMAMDKRETGIVSIMHSNNEIGTVNDIKELAEIAHEGGALFHSDCTQSIGTFKIDVKDIDCDYLTFSGHKIHAPKGIGVLYVKNRKLFPLTPIIHGGSNQEFGLRGGTENVMNINAIGVACDTLYNDFDGDIKAFSEYITSLKVLFYNVLREEIAKNMDYGWGNVHINGAKPSEIGKVLNLTFRGIDAESLVLLLSSHGVMVSAGSACTSREQVPSHVLKAIGVSDEDAYCSIRFSFSEMNAMEDVADAAKIVAKCIGFLSQMRGL